MTTLTSKVKDFFGFEEASPSPIQTKAKPAKSFKGSLISSNTQAFSSSKIMITEAKIYEDSLSIAKYLREGNPVIVNLKYLDTDTGKRLIDFVCGTAFAINGHMLKIGENIFLFTPANVNIANSEEDSSIGESLEGSEQEILFKQATG